MLGMLDSFHRSRYQALYSNMNVTVFQTHISNIERRKVIHPPIAAFTTLQT